MSPVIQNKKLTGFLVGLLAVVAFYCAPKIFVYHRNNWFFANLLIFYTWTLPVIILHESAHAIVGRWQGMRVFKIRIGRGGQIFAKRIFGLNFRINLWPSSGDTTMATNQKRRLRSRFWLAVFAGPASHIVILAALYFLMGQDLNVKLVFTKNLFAQPIPLEMLFYFNALALVFNLMPIKFSGSMTGLKSDGHHLVTIPFLKERDLNTFIDFYAVLEGQDLLDTGDYVRGIAFYREALSKDPDSFLLRFCLATGYLLAGEFRPGRAEFASLLDSIGPDEEKYRLPLLNNIAWANLFLRDRDLLKESSIYSRELLDSSADVVTYQGTRGSVLVSNGHTAKGLKLLRLAYRNHSDERSRSSVACWIAVGEAKLGNPDRARSWLLKAKTSCPWLPYFAFIEEEISIALTPVKNVKAIPVMTQS